MIVQIRNRKKIRLKKNDIRPKILINEIGISAIYRLLHQRQMKAKSISEPMKQ